MNAPLAKEQIALLMSDSLTYRMSPVQGTDGTTYDAGADVRPSAFAVFARRIGRAVSALLTLPLRRTVINELSLLSDRELADIGLTRGELGRVFDPNFAAKRSAV